MSPTFTILVPTYNQAVYLPDCLGSLRAQTLGDWEAVVVNDGSTDGTREVLERHTQEDPRIRPFHQANGGVGAALNRALREARGEWICWLSSDDLLEPAALAAFAKAIAEAPEVAYFHSDFQELVHETGQRRPGPPDRARALPPKALQTLQFFHGNYIHGISICVRKALFDRAGFFKPELRYAQDMDMWLRMSALAELRYVDIRTCVTRVHGGQGTLGFPEAGLLDSARACLDFLNEHPFEELFPHLDLSSGEGITQAVQAALGAALNLQACMYAGVGVVPALLERMGEWLAERCPIVYRPSLRMGLQELEAQLGPAPEPIRRQIHAMAHHEEIRYEAKDPLALVRSNRDALQRSGNPASAALLSRYLAKVAPAPERSDALPEAFLLEPDFAGDGWLEALVAYLNAFQAGDPVGLLLLLDPRKDGSPTAGEVGGVVTEVARQLGRDTFPDVVLVEKPADVLEVLRPYRRIHRLPFAGGRPPLETAASLRFAQSSDRP